MTFKTPCGTWYTTYLDMDPWFIAVDGDTDQLKQEVADWCDANLGPGQWKFTPYSCIMHDAAMEFATDAGAILFRMFWDERVPGFWTR